MKKLIFLATFLFLAVPAAFCDVPSETPTVTETITETTTITETSTPENTATITPTSTETTIPTATLTHTSTPVAQGKVFAYPNPVPKGAKEIGIAYPLSDNTEMITIYVYASDGTKVATIVDPTPNGYTNFKIEKLARGIYLYQVFIEYSDGSTKTQPPAKFAIIK